MNLLLETLETLIGKTSKERFKSVEFRNYLMKKIGVYLKLMRDNSDSQKLESAGNIISMLLIILGNIGYEFLENVVCFILHIDGKDSGGSIVHNVLEKFITNKERDDIDPNQILRIIERNIHYGGNRYSSYLNQLIKGNVDRMFKKEVAVVDSNPELAEILKKIIDMATNIP